MQSRSPSPSPKLDKKEMPGDDELIGEEEASIYRRAARRLIFVAKRRPDT